jgi:hypothetical protein
MPTYKINLPENWDYQGRVQIISGSIEASTPKNALTMFLKRRTRQGENDGLTFYAKFLEYGINDIVSEIPDVVQELPKEVVDMRRQVAKAKTEEERILKNNVNKEFNRKSAYQRHFNSLGKLEPSVLEKEYQMYYYADGTPRPLNVPKQGKLFQ